MIPNKQFLLHTTYGSIKLLQSIYFIMGRLGWSEGRREAFENPPQEKGLAKSEKKPFDLQVALVHNGAKIVLDRMKKESPDDYINFIELVSSHGYLPDEDSSGEFFKKYGKRFDLDEDLPKLSAMGLILQEEGSEE